MNTAKKSIEKMKKYQANSMSEMKFGNSPLLKHVLTLSAKLKNAKLTKQYGNQKAV